MNGATKNRREYAVVLFGPKGSGKTMLLHRLCLYLHKQGLTLRQHGMQNVTVTQNGKMVCHILDPIGNECFNPLCVDYPLPNSITDSMKSDCQRVWLFFAEQNYADFHMREQYTKRVAYLCSHIIPHKDKFIIVVPKIDMCDFVHVNKASEIRHYAYELLHYQYPNFLRIFANTQPITKLFKPYNCDVVAFSAGLFSKSADGELLYEDGDSTFPKLLWGKIIKSL